MKLEKRETDNFYTVEMDKAGEELLICYWCFDTLEVFQPPNRSDSITDQKL